MSWAERFALWILQRKGWTSQQPGPGQRLQVQVNDGEAIVMPSGVLVTEWDWTSGTHVVRTVRPAGSAAMVRTEHGA